MNAPFQRVVEQHGAMVLRVCRAILDEHDAEDAWSSTFLSALQAYPALPGDADVSAWLVTIAHHKAIDVVRARARHATLVAEPPDGPSTLGIPGSRDLDLDDALRRLPDKQRRAVVYHHLAGVPYRQIAELLGGTPEAARRAASDGIAALRQNLAASDPKALSE